MKFEKYNPVDEKESCVIRTFSKLFNKDFYRMKKELIEYAKESGYNSYNDIEVFESYLLKNNYKKQNIAEELIENMSINYKKCAVLCHKDDYYHMIPIIDNTIYDKDKDCLKLYAISLYYEIN